MKVREILRITQGELLSGSAGREVDPAGISTDTRSVKAGDFFIALKGPNFDGNNFIGEAFEKGAVGVMVDRRPALKDVGPKAVIIQVGDTIKAMQDIASAHRIKFNIPVIAVTGSNGKTTAKEMIAAVLSRRFNVLKNIGTENNHIGVPATLLKMKPSHEVCVLELGTNHKGEIRLLAGIAKPTMAVITNIGPSHLEFLGSLEGVYEEKKDILRFLGGEERTLIINGDDKYLAKLKPAKTDVVRYGFKRSNDFCAEALKPAKDSLSFVVNSKAVYELNMCGAHNIYNALTAIATASRFGIGYKEVRRALFEYRPPKMRLDIKKVKGFDIINDSYNSNPLSMSSALEMLKYYPARAKWVVSADMLELGKHAVKFHKLIGEKIAESGVDGLLTFGEFSRHTLSQANTRGMNPSRLWHCKDHGQIAGILRKIVKEGDAVLLKGSRSMRMEEVLKKLE